MENNQFDMDDTIHFSTNGQQTPVNPESAIGTNNHNNTIPYRILQNIIFSYAQIEGNIHRQNFQSCEDVLFIRSTQDFLFCGIADGQSNTKYGAEGGLNCLEAVFNYIAARGVDNLLNIPFPDELPCMFVKEFRKKLLTLAEIKNMDLKEFASTLLAIVVDLKSRKYMILHIGDGCALGVQNTGDVAIISPPDNGITLHHTWLTTSPHAVAHLRVTFGILEYQKRILLTSDGATCFCRGNNISWRSKELIKNGTQLELQNYLLSSNPSDDASCIILDCFETVSS